MPKKPVDPVISMAGSFQQTVQLLAAAVEKRGGNLAEALVLLARPAYAAQCEAVAEILASLHEPAQETLGPQRNPLVEKWISFYEKHFPEQLAATGGVEELHVLKLPPKRDGFTRPIVVLKGLTTNAVYAACEKHFPCWRYVDDLDANVPANDRQATASYAVWVRDRVEADEEFTGKSANDLTLISHRGITLLERMLYELKFFDETNGSHLDLKNVTLCTGSRLAGGGVPYADWDGGKFRVDWTDPRNRHPCLRSREVVSG